MICRARSGSIVKRCENAPVKIHWHLRRNVIGISSVLPGVLHGPELTLLGPVASLDEVLESLAALCVPRFAYQAAMLVLHEVLLLESPRSVVCSTIPDLAAASDGVLVHVVCY